jgi:t-SNARE complex subunit (syntaxin)
MNAEPIQIPYSEETRPPAETVHLIRKQVERMRKQVNQANHERETRVKLLRALRRIRP